jgi:hypothetical protein
MITPTSAVFQAETDLLADSWLLVYSVICQFNLQESRDQDSGHDQNECAWEVLLVDGLLYVVGRGSCTETLSISKQQRFQPETNSVYSETESLGVPKHGGGKERRSKSGKTNLPSFTYP